MEDGSDPNIDAMFLRERSCAAEEMVPDIPLSMEVCWLRNPLACVEFRKNVLQNTGLPEVFEGTVRARTEEHLLKLFENAGPRKNVDHRCMCTQSGVRLRMVLATQERTESHGTHETEGIVLDADGRVIDEADETLSEVLFPLEGIVEFTGDRMPVQGIDREISTVSIGLPSSEDHRLWMSSIGGCVVFTERCDFEGDPFLPHTDRPESCSTIVVALEELRDVLRHSFCTKVDVLWHRL
jgi:hypothetical protein